MPDSRGKCEAKPSQRNFKLARLTTRVFACLKVEKLVYVCQCNENNNENGLAWYSPLALCFASIVVVCSYHPNAQAPNNPSRGEANGRCDITPNVSGRCFFIYRYSTTSQVHVVLRECWGL